jgi:hypothetical protein
MREVESSSALYYFLQRRLIRMKINKLGELRPNQLITTFGPGSILDALYDSVTVLDINYWTSMEKQYMIQD